MGASSGGGVDVTVAVGVGGEFSAAVGVNVVGGGDRVGDGVVVASSGVGEDMNVADNFVGEAISAVGVVGVGSEVEGLRSGVTVGEDSLLSSVVGCVATKVGKLTNRSFACSSAMSR